MFLRIVKHGQITDLSAGFRLPENEPFTICIVPKTIQATHLTTVQCKLVSDTASGALPVIYNDWSPALIKNLEPNSIDLAHNDVYWGSGNNL